MIMDARQPTELSSTLFYSTVNILQGVGSVCYYNAGFSYSKLPQMCTNQLVEFANGLGHIPLQVGDE